MKTKQLLNERTKLVLSEELADAHSHLDLITDPVVIKDAIDAGVRTIITDGVDTKSNIRCLELADNLNIFAMLGIDPEHCAGLTDEELEFNIGMIRNNRNKVVGIGEIGLDYMITQDPKAIARQKQVFARFLALADELGMPVSVHSRSAFDDVLEAIDSSGVKDVHIHFFEGDVQQAREAEKRGFMISVPPIETAKRKRVIKYMPIDNIMAESDSPVVGASPKAVEFSVGIVAEAKGLDFNRAAEALRENTRRFFKTHLMAKGSFMRF